MPLRPLLVLVLAPVLSAACCCGPPPTLPDASFAGTWALDGSMPTGSGVGTLRQVVLTVSPDLGGANRLTGLRDSGDSLRAAVELLRAPPGEVRFRVDHTAPLDSLPLAFSIVAAGPLRDPRTLEVRFSRTATGASLGAGVFRRR